MNPPIAEHAPEGGRNDQNARPASIRKGGRLQSETAADFAGMRTMTQGQDQAVAGGLPGWVYIIAKLDK
jgi:hypothetical protein